MASWKDVAVSPATPLIEAIAKIDATGLQVALVLEADGTLCGILTDGNVRRAILDGKGLGVPVSEIMNVQPTSVAASASREEMLALMRLKVFHHLPLVDEAGRVVGLVTLDELIGAVERPNWVVLMAGGLGSRLQPLTDGLPKPLIEVNGKPILETIIESFAEQGFKRIFLSVNYKAEMIRSYFGEGTRWGVQIDYLHEIMRLGTAGALSLLPRKPTAPLVVMNGDLLTRANFQALLQFHDAQSAVATMAVREYDFQVPYGVVQLDGAQIKSVEEKPVQKFFVNAGIYALSPGALEHLPADTFFDMPTLFEQLIAARKATAAYPLREYWLDIGRMEELEQAQREWGEAPGMIGDKKVIAVIPARGGSKGLPGKNVKLLCGKPLINWTIQVAGKSRFIDELAVSTDSEQIAQVARNAGASVPFVRPVALATDATPTIAVVEHALNYYRLALGQSFHYVVLLEPTSPLREDDDIDNMLLKLHGDSSMFDSIVSLGEVSEHPSIMKRISGDGLEPFCLDLQMTTRRQDNQPAFFPYGVAYIAKVDSLMLEKTFYTKRCTYHIIKRYQNYEIDNIYDFLAVENVMRYEWNLG